jgi:heat shock transcription factor
LLSNNFQDVNELLIAFSSFLDESKNTDLIRWSDDGNSFIVLDEDEFARTLIPELFKHNNYASFVRQLNMYGFHKKVGLSDNSMRASERKNKSPSEYANPYFKRGHPDLLWLIQKPKNVSGQGSKSGKGAKVKSEEGEDNEVDEYAEDGGRDERTRPRGQLALSPGQNFLPKEQLAGVYRELQTIRQQQQIISSTISKLRREHEQLYAQAASFQEQHTRHENSINAILTFLATVYNRSLQGHDGQQNLTNPFSGIISQDQGNVVDVDEYALSTLAGDVSPGKPGAFKKQQLLLKAPPKQVDAHGRASTLSPSASSTYDLSSNSRKSSHIRQPSVSQPGSIEEIHDTSPQQTASQTSAPQLPQRDILSVIQNSNARNGIPTTFSEFPSVLSSLENSGGHSALTPNQRADMLRLMADETNGTDPSAIASANNALITPTPPPMPHNYSARLASTREEIDNLAKMQAQQDRSVQNLTNLLQPLSPTGSIPGLGDTNVPPPSLDLDQIFNSHDYFTDMPDMDKSGYDFGDSTVTTGAGPSAGAATDMPRDVGSDLFDFDNLAGGDGTELFEDPTNTSLPNNRPSQPAAYFGYDGVGGYNTNPTGADVSGSGSGGGGGGVHESGRIVETFTDSEATSPANTVDENLQQLNIPTGDSGGGAGGATGPGNAIHSPKRRKKI